MDAHVEKLFSEAYDETLAPAAQQRFDSHLESCAACASAWREFTASVDALRALPAARMPVRVQLPAGSPSAAGRDLLARLSAGFRRWQRPFTAVAVTAAAAVAVAVLSTAHGTQLPAAGSGGGGASGARPPVAAAAPNMDRGAAAPAFPCAPGPATASSSPPSGAPQGFGYQVSGSNPSVASQRLYLATTSEKVSAGATVIVYARLVDGDAVSIPCVGVSSTASYAGPVPSGGAAAGSAAVSAPGARVDVPASVSPTITIDGGPALTVAIPAGLVKGTVLDLVAYVPESSGHGTAFQLSLALVVS